MRYKGYDIVSATVFGEKGFQLYRAVYVIAPDGYMIKTDSEDRAKWIVDRRTKERTATDKGEEEAAICAKADGSCKA